MHYVKRVIWLYEFEIDFVCLVLYTLWIYKILYFLYSQHKDIQSAK